MVRYLLILLVLLFPHNCFSQDKAGSFKTYNDFIKESYIDKSFKEGTYYILVSADWCAPCQKLKEQIKKVIFPKGKNIILVDYDKEETIRKKLLEGTDKTIPKLFRYKVDSNGKGIRTFYNGAGLEGFFNDK
jgi:thiol-disulfide isomerase/thioredoxin